MVDFIRKITVLVFLWTLLIAGIIISGLLAYLFHREMTD